LPLVNKDDRTDESMRKAAYSHVKNLAEADSAYLKEAESVIAASHKAKLEAERLKSRIETAVEDTGPRRPVSMYERSSPVYYAMDSAFRTKSKDDSIVRREVEDDLADEIELIRLAADLSSRRLMAEQKRDSGSGSSSRTRIRALLDKQRNQREEEEKARQEKRESQDFNRYLWVYR